MTTPRRKASLALVALAFAAILAHGTARDPNFWRTADQRGDALLRAGQFAAAGRVYTDPWRVGVAQYRDGDFAAAAHTFERVPGPSGAYDAGNAWLMQGRYDQAIAAYEHALALRPGWKDAEENRALAVARRDRLAAAGDKDEGGAPQMDPDEIVFDQRGRTGRSLGQDLTGGDPLPDAALQATWLRRVQTTPGDFLRAKFAYEAQHAAATRGDRAENAR